MIRKFYSGIILLCFLGCSDIIEVEDISNKNTTILAPTDQSVLATTTVNFNWDGVEGAENYRLQIATPNFNSAIQIVLDSTLTSTNFVKELEIGNYEWRIRAENSDYQTEYSTQSFTIEE